MKLVAWPANVVIHSKCEELRSCVQFSMEPRGGASFDYARRGLSSEAWHYFFGRDSGGTSPATR